MAEMHCREINPIADHGAVCMDDPPSPERHEDAGDEEEDGHGDRERAARPPHPDPSQPWVRGEPARPRYDRHLPPALEHAFDQSRGLLLHPPGSAHVIGDESDLP